MEHGRNAHMLTVALVALTLSMTLLPSAALASDADVTVTDADAPIDSVTLAPGGSGAITISISVTGKQDGTATFKVYTTWTLADGVFTGSDPQEFEVPQRPVANAAANTFETEGIVIVDDDQTAGAFTLAVGVFDITNSNTTGAKLAPRNSSDYEVSVEEEPPAPTYYHVSYDGNGNTGGTAPTDDSDYETGEEVTVLGQGTLVRSGYTFSGWNTAANGSGTSYGEGHTFSMPEDDVTLYAEWSLSTLYLHNYPTPPTAHTNTQAPLPMDVTAPTATTLYRYSDNMNDYPGREIKKDGNGPTTTDLTKYQTWTYTPSTDLVINGDVVLTFWARHKDSTKVIKFQAQLYDGSTSFATAYVSASMGSTFAERTITFSSVSRTISVGQMLTLRLYNYDSESGASQDDGIIAYDTTSYPSRLILP